MATWPRTRPPGRMREMEMVLGGGGLGVCWRGGRVRGVRAGRNGVGRGAVGGGVARGRPPTRVVSCEGGLVEPGGRPRAEFRPEEEAREGGGEGGGDKAEGGEGREEPVEWVKVINSALAHHPVALVVVLLALDWCAAYFFIHAYRFLGLSPDADFAFAFALNKGVVRYPRYVLDATLAAWAVTAWPELGRVKVGRLWTAWVALGRAASRARRRIFPRRAVGAEVGGGSPTGGPRETPRSSLRPGRTAGRALRSLWGRLGFAFIIVKSVTGPATVLGTWALLRAGVDVPGALAALGIPALTSLGRNAGLIAAGFTTSAVMGFPIAIAAALIVKTLGRTVANSKQSKSRNE